jgi:tetratricopeptide (TPR) repeat protein
LYHPVSGVFPNLEKLLTIARTGVTVLPASPQMRNRYASALTEAGRFEEAVREFEQYARLSPREPNPFDSLGGVYLALGAPAKAIDSYSRALAIDPGFPSGTGLAYAFGMLGGTRRRLPQGRRSCMCMRFWCLAPADTRKRSASCGADWLWHRSTTTCSSSPACT